jgi:heme exporter protein C
MTRRDKALGLARTGQIVTLVALLALAGVFVRALMFTPMDRLQGLAQKILYMHAPAAITALMAYAVCGILSIVYLGLRDRRLDRAAAASAEVGVVLSVILLITGPLWGKPVWGTWWTWDARLTSTLFIFLLFVGYLIMRDSVIDPDQRARFSSVIGVLGLVLVPFIHLTVYLFRTLHPEPMLLKPSAPSMPGVMLVTYVSSIGVFVLLYVGFVIQRYAVADLRELRDEEMWRDS